MKTDRRFFWILILFFEIPALGWSGEIEVRHLHSLVGAKKHQKYGYGFALERTVDVDGRGVNDFLVGNPEEQQIQIISGEDFSELKRFSAMEKEDFGYTLLSPGDITGDGKPDFIFGNPVATKDPPGSVGIFRSREDGGYDPKWIPGFESSFTFGRGLAWLGGAEQIFAVTAPSFTGGRVYFFDVRDGKYLRETDFRFVFTKENDRKGYLAWRTPDLDGGGPDLAVGAPGQRPTNDLNFPSRGRIYFYSGQTGKLLTVLEGSRPTSHLGMSFAVIGDQNKDGFEDIAVGAPYQNCDGGERCGAVYILDGAKIGNLNLVPKIFTVEEDADEVIFPVRGTRHNELLGFQVEGFADIGGDCVPEFLFSAPGANNQKGEIRIIKGDDFSTLATIPGPPDGMWFGATLKTDRAFSRIYVSSPYYSSSKELMFQGRVDIYDVRPLR